MLVLKGRRRAAPALHASQEEGSILVLICEGLGNPIHRVASLSSRRALACANLECMMSSSMKLVDRIVLVCDDMYCRSKDIGNLVPVDESFM